MNKFSYINFIQQAPVVAECLPLKANKFAQNTFSYRQMIILLILRQKLDLSYRRFVNLLEVTKIPELLHLKRIPDHSTLYKFAKRMGCNLIERFLLATPLSSNIVLLFMQQALNLIFNLTIWHLDSV